MNIKSKTVYFCAGWFTDKQNKAYNEAMEAIKENSTIDVENSYVPLQHQYKGIRVDEHPEVLEGRCQPRIIFWLGFRPFAIEELHQLLPDLTDVALKGEITSLQNLRIVNPVVDEENKYSLTDDGNDLRNMVLTMSVWGRQQMDDSANRVSTQIVEPEKDASMSELIKYNEKLNEYI